MKPLILVTAPVGTRSGYGSRSRDIVRALVKLDKYDVKVFNVPWGNTPQNALMIDHPKDKPIIDNLLVKPNLDRQPDIHIHIVVPNEFQPYGKFNIGITAGLEATLIPKEWIEGCNRMDLVLASSNFSKEVLLKTVYEEKNQQGQVVNTLQVNSPVEVLFEGVDTEVYNTTNEFDPIVVDELGKIKTDFNYLFVGHWLQGGFGNDRKDVGRMIHTFLQTFKNKEDQPGLILKTSGAGYSIIDKDVITKRIKEIQAKFKDELLPPIYFLHGDLTDEQMNQLYNHPKVSAHISFTHGEGFGRPLLEATMSGKPVIASAATGHIDFLKPEYSMLVNGNYIPVHKDSFPKNIYVEGQHWFDVNLQEAANSMKFVKSRYKKFTELASQQKIINEVEFSFDKMVELLGTYIDKVPTAVEMKLPKLGKLPKLNKVGS